jgi:hypothetical protein
MRVFCGVGVVVSWRSKNPEFFLSLVTEMLAFFSSALLREYWNLDIQPPGTNPYFWYEFVPATMAAVVGRTQQTNKNRGDVRLPIVSRTACILIFIMIPSAGGDIVLRAPALGPIMVASTTHNSGLWVEA